ncbi:MAG: DUF1570 domain-containing protein [Planctomycetota bacterium]|nr:MAG: DUF1570 domain-containing protein [Planctomycetota bacterium]
MATLEARRRTLSLLVLALLICVCLSNASANDRADTSVPNDLLAATANHQELIERLLANNDWRLLRFVMGRSGISTAWNEERVQDMARSMQRRGVAIARASLQHAGMIWDSASVMDQRFVQWQEIISDQQPWQHRCGPVQLLGVEDDRELLSRLAAALPLVQDLHRRYFPFNQSQERPVHIRIFPTREKYDSQDFRAGSYATYRPRQALVALWIDHQAYASDADAEAVRLIQALCHELWHAYIQYHAPGMPVWMEEGLAEIFESAVVRGDQPLQIGPDIINATNKQVLRQNLDAGRVIPLQSLMEFSNTRFSEEAQIAYPQAWSVMHSLLFAEDDAFSAIVPDVIAALRSGSFGVEAVRSAVVELDWQTIEAHWRERLEQQQETPPRPSEYPPSPL